MSEILKKCDVCHQNKKMRDKWYCLLDNNKSQDICSECGDKNQATYKQKGEKIYIHSPDTLQVIEPGVKDKCQKCQATTGGDNYTGLIHSPINSPRRSSKCWEKDKCSCSSHLGEENLIPKLIKDCPNRYETKDIFKSHWYKQEDKIKEAQKNDPKWDVKNNKHKEDNDNIEREKERDEFHNGEVKFSNWRA